MSEQVNTAPTVASVELAKDEAVVAFQTAEGEVTTLVFSTDLVLQMYLLHQDVYVDNHYKRDVYVKFKLDEIEGLVHEVYYLEKVDDEESEEA